MRLIGKIMNRMTVVLMATLLAWCLLFYYAIQREMIDEVEDSLELQAEMLMIRYLAGEEIPPREIGTNNSYAIIPVTEDYAATYPPMSFESKDIWVPQRHETEPARILRMIFRDNENRPMLLEISTPTFDQDELQLAILIWSIVLYAILLSLVLSINWGVIQSSMKPLYAMLRWLDSFDLKYNNQPMHIETNTTEFRRLIDAANRLVVRVQELYDQQRRFVDNAAHEMQTPLAVCLNRLEELQQRSDLNEEQLADIDRVRQPLRRLNRLHRDMLQLSRIHNGAYTDCEEIKVYPLLRAMQEDFEDIFSHKEIRCLVEGNTELSVKMNPTLADLLLGNLFRNAWLHTPTGGEIRVKLSEDTVVFSNTGKDALDAERIFQRFYHSAATPQSSGLGLSICESVCRQYGFRLDYSFGDGMHHFTCCLIQS